MKETKAKTRKRYEQPTLKPVQLTSLAGLAMACACGPLGTGQ
ncbi:hypothetical protein [Glycomyces artemisiae]|uniref:Uncharacterized protein n=1 Tax=Glycomyces artemisiae TaxID=1076443 RepID=A0A2T0ULB9_9ACTN|nr:hypothetical protein [Glycomyces artemisiae]PRY58637.1 hypothetical protein B0I28_105352 [Glycomyces artemisiae]